MQLFLDLDGVLADFDAGAEKILGMPPAQYEAKFGQKKFWNDINEKSGGSFFWQIPVMDRAYELYEAVVNLKPVILTGVPSSPRAAIDKVNWVHRYFGREQAIRTVCTFASEKYRFCHPGDILVDDREKYKDSWTGVGGVWITYHSVPQVLRELAENGVPIKTKALSGN